MNKHELMRDLSLASSHSSFSYSKFGLFSNAMKKLLLLIMDNWPFHFEKQNKKL
jgi:hypothetical protein